MISIGSKNKRLFGLIYFLVLISIYLFPNNRNSNNYYYTECLNIIITIMIIYFITIKVINDGFILKNIRKIDTLIFFFIIAIVIATYMSRKYINVQWIYLLFIYFFYKDRYNLDSRYNRIFLIVISLCVSLQMLIFRFDDGRPIISWDDPNYSGFFIFLLFLMLHVCNLKKVSYFILLLGFFTISRNYLLAVFIFFTLNNKKIISLLIKLRLNHFMILVLFCLLSLMVVEHTIVSDARLSGVQVTNIDNKLTTLVDASNRNRFLANIKIREDLIKNFDRYAYGCNVDVFLNKVFPYNAPHNAIYSAILNYGIFFTFLYLILLGNIYNYLAFKRNIPIIISIMSYYMLLGVGLIGFPLLMIIYILYINNINQLNISKN